MLEGSQERDRERFRNIALVGSIPYQLRWCAHGSKDKYILLDELVEQSAYRARENATRYTRGFSVAEREALLRYAKRLDELIPKVPWNDPNVPIKVVIESDESMRLIRKAATECLHEVGVEFTDEELLAEDE